MSRGILRNGTDLFQNLTISLNEVARLANVDPASVRRIRMGKEPVLRHTAVRVAQVLAAQGVDVSIDRDFHPVEYTGKARKLRK